MVGGLLGALQAGVILLWPAQVPPERYSHPFDATGYAVAQVSFVVQHRLLFGVVLGLVAVAWRPGSWLARTGLLVMAVGLLLLTGNELNAIRAAAVLAGSPVAVSVDNSYGVPMTAMGLGLLLAGLGVVRRRLLPGWARWLPLLLGVYVFAVLFPAVFGFSTAARLAIGGWMLLFALLGRELVRLGRVRTPSR